MSKKLITACLGLVAFAAFVLPAVASASPQITHPTGTRLDPETGECTGVKKTICIVGTNVGATKLLTDPTEGEAKVLSECSTAKVTGYLTKNTGTAIEGTIHTATFSGTGGELFKMHECTSTALAGFGNLTPTTNGGGTDEENVVEGTPWCITASGASDVFKVRGGACGAATTKIRFILDATKKTEPTKSIECKYSRSAETPVEGTIQTDTETGKDAILSIKPGNTSAERAKTTFKGETGNSIECPSTGTLEMSFTLETDTVSTEPLYIS
jgi:hypothetical protein